MAKKSQFHKRMYKAAKMVNGMEEIKAGMKNPMFPPTYSDFLRDQAKRKGL